MRTCWIWLICFFSSFYSNFSTLYKASRTIYTQTSAAPLCNDYIETTFNFDDTTNEVTITIFSSTNTSWFGIGLPKRNLYYDKTIRKNTIMNGYAIIHMSDTVQEYDITGSNTIDTMTLQASPNDIIVDSIVNSGGTVTVIIRRNLTSADTNDFEFNFPKYAQCYPFLLTVAIGNGLTFAANDNTYGSSYLYIYDQDLELDTSVYPQTWNDVLGQSDIAFTENRPFNVTFAMNPTTQIVDVTVEDGPTPGETNQWARSWGLSFPDLADVAYYHPANPDPINMDSDYAVIYGIADTTTYADLNLPMCLLDQASQIITETRLPKDGTTCDTALTNYSPARADPPGPPHDECWDLLPNQQVVYLGYSDISDVETYTFQLKFKSCGYEFNPYEYKTCRPFTIVSMAINTFSRCMQDIIVGETGSPPVHHQVNKIQIDDFPTREPTKAPTATPTLAPSIAPTSPPSLSPTSPPSLAPSNAPSLNPSVAPSYSPTTPPSTAPSTSPSRVPTHAPVNPTTSPTKPTNSPTEAPSSTPTARPTDLPTVNVSALNYPPCPGLLVKHLDVLFDGIATTSVAQPSERFNEIDEIYNRRRVWSNGVLSVHFENRFADAGDWVITDGSYSAISISDANFNNSLVYNTSDPTIMSPHSLPGPYPSGFIYYDHFPHDNILGKPDAAVTLYFECENTSYPTTDPTPSPTTPDPTLTPTTAMPTIAPTANCTAWCADFIWQVSGVCDVPVTEGFLGLGDVHDCFLKRNDIDGRANWVGVGDIRDFTLGYNEFHQQWVIDGTDGYSATTDGDGKYPPNYGIWDIYAQDNPFTRSCEIRIRYTCYGTGIPTKAPSESPTTAQPTTSEPSKSPTFSPSDAPTIAPTFSPSEAPSLAPTGAPISQCLGFELRNTEYLDGLYGRAPFVDPDTGKYYWNKIKGDGQIFWSSSSLHESWIIYSESEERYWLSNTKPYHQPALINKWQLYLGASPFIEATRTLELVCFRTLPPTEDPTLAPSQTPTLAPSVSPSNAPTQPPSQAPTPAPTDVPTKSPTTLDPTYDPTTDPTQMPTEDPTAEPCDFMIIGNPENAAEMDIYTGVYTQSTNTNWQRDISYESETYGFFLFVVGNDWRISNSHPIYKTLTLEIKGRGYRPPYFANNWQFNSGQPRNYSLAVECSKTTVPTNAPTMAPSIAPSMSPTSACRGLYFNNTDMADYQYNGEYSRQDDYYINNHKYWIATDHLATIAYIHGHWYLSEKDNDIIDDEDPLMLTMYGADLLSPPSGVWLYADESPDDFTSANATVEITCDATRYPTVNPTFIPSTSPTKYVAHVWSYCPDFRPYFTFISVNTSAVYWPEPMVEQHNYDINISVDPEMYPGGDIITPGKYEIIYTATDNSPRTTSITCVVTVYVIGGAPYGTSYEYCKRERFHIDLEFNDTYYKLSDDEEETLGDDENEDTVVSSTKLKGIIYDPMLQTDGQNCYVTATQIANYDTVKVDEEPAKSTFLGMEAVNLIWEILVLILIIILICLIVDCLYRLYKDKKATQNKKDDEQNEKLLANQRLSDQEENANPSEQKENETEINTGDIEMQERADDD